MLRFYDVGNRVIGVEDEKVFEFLDFERKEVDKPEQYEEIQLDWPEKTVHERCRVRTVPGGKWYKVAVSKYFRLLDGSAVEIFSSIVEAWLKTLNYVPTEIAKPEECNFVYCSGRPNQFITEHK